MPNYLPLEASFTGRLQAKPDALYLSPQRSVVGFSFYSAGQPLHLTIVSGSGGGKSMLVGDMLSQTQLDFLGIIDYGQSHEVLVRTLCPECRPFVIQANGGITFNYLDPCESVITPDFLSNTGSIVLVTIGQRGDERLGYRIRGVITRAVQQLYEWKLRELERENFSQALHIARLGVAFEGACAKDRELTLLEVFSDYRQLEKEDPERAHDFAQDVSEGTALEFMKAPSTRLTAAYLAAAWLSPEECPTHSDLQQFLEFEASAADRQLAHEIAEPMAEWRRDGPYGKFIDGVSSVDFNTPVAYIEMGKIQDTADALKAVACILVKQFLWLRIYGLPRFLKKLLLFEEASAFFDIPGSEPIVRRAYEQARKYNTVIGTVWQNYARLRESSIRAPVMGNSQQFFLMKQSDPRDLTSLAEDLNLSTTAMNAIRDYPRPAEAGESHFTLLCRDVPHDVCGTAIHRPSPSVFYATCSTAAHVERRRRELAGAENVAERIQQLTKNL